MSIIGRPTAAILTLYTPPYSIAPYAIICWVRSGRGRGRVTCHRTTISFPIGSTASCIAIPAYVSITPFPSVSGCAMCNGSVYWWIPCWWAACPIPICTATTCTAVYVSSVPITPNARRSVSVTGSSCVYKWYIACCWAARSVPVSSTTSCRTVHRAIGIVTRVPMCSWKNKYTNALQKNVTWRSVVDEGLVQAGSPCQTFDVSYQICMHPFAGGSDAVIAVCANRTFLRMRLSWRGSEQGYVTSNRRLYTH